MTKNRKVILLVDDEKIILHTLMLQLKRSFGSSYTYEMAESGEEALECIEELAEEGIDLLAIISDQIMPGIYGDELLKRVHKICPNCITIMLSGQVNEEFIKNASDKPHIFRFFGKPWDDAELVAAIREGEARLQGP